MAIDKIFPSAQLGVTRSYCRVFYEHNVTNLISQIVDTDIFVISLSTDKKVLEFNINGYYVKYSSKSPMSNLWVGKLLTFTQDINNPELIAVVENDEITSIGISITETQPVETDADKYYQLLIGGTINPEYQVKFDAKSLPRIIDCGTINN